MVTSVIASLGQHNKGEIQRGDGDQRAGYDGQDDPHRPSPATTAAVTNMRVRTSSTSARVVCKQIGMRGRAKTKITLVRLGSLSAAARELNIAQPALTHHIAQIERDLGAPVLVWHQSGVRPTELGERLMAHAVEILDRVGQAEHDLLLLARQGTLTEKTIHLTIIPSLASALTAEFLAGVAEILPHVDLHLIKARSGCCGTLIETGKADIAILLVNPDEVESEPLIWESLYWITCARDRPVAGPGAAGRDFADAADPAVAGQPGAPMPANRGRGAWPEAASHG